MSELEPCPFCGWEFRMRFTGQRSYQCCTQCGARGPLADTGEEADAAWNRRASPWRPIEDIEPTRNVIIALYDVNSEDRNKAIQAFRDGSKWRVAAFNSADYEEIEPHHFMPMPEPPKEKSE